MFGDAVIYLCRHDDEGAFGIVLNKPTPLTVGELLDSLDVDAPDDLPQAGDFVLSGGPVQPEQVFILHRPLGAFGATLEVGERDIGVTTSRDILSALSAGDAPRQMQFAVGYAGWGAGQLEREIKENAWLAALADERILFELPPAKRLAEAARKMGFDLSALADSAGHA
jgi:putative transcriptional regulator